jgi:hypothetical protein
MNQLRQCNEWYWLGEMLLDVGGNDALLPDSKAAPRWLSGTPNIAVNSHEFTRNHDSERFAIAIRLRGVLDCFGQLDRRFPHHVVFKEQAGCE